MIVTVITVIVILIVIVIIDFIVECPVQGLLLASF